MTQYASAVAISLTLSVLFPNSAKSSSENRTAVAAPNSELERKNDKVRREFDAVVLKSLLDPVLATGRNGSTGLGKAGRYWQSLMSEHLARHIADSRQLSILGSRRDAPRATHGNSMAASDVRGACTWRDGAHGGSWHTFVVRDGAKVRPSLLEWSRADSENANSRR